MLCAKIALELFCDRREIGGVRHFDLAAGAAGATGAADREPAGAVAAVTAAAADALREDRVRALTISPLLIDVHQAAVASGRTATADR